MLVDSYMCNMAVYPCACRPNFTLTEQGLNRLLAIAMSAEPNLSSVNDNFYQLLQSERFQVVGL